jgi:hypothetical protein
MLNVECRMLNGSSWRNKKARQVFLAGLRSWVTALFVCQRAVARPRPPGLVKPQLNERKFLTAAVTMQAIYASVRSLSTTKIVTKPKYQSCDAVGEHVIFVVCSVPAHGRAGRAR